MKAAAAARALAGPATAPFPTRNQLITIETAIAHGGREAVSRRHALRWWWCGGGHGAWAAAAAQVLAGPATTPWPTQHQRNNNRELTQRRMQRARESGISYRPLAKRTGLLKKHGPASGRNKAATPPAIPATGPATWTTKTVVWASGVATRTATDTSHSRDNRSTRAHDEADEHHRRTICGESGVSAGEADYRY